MSSDCSDAAGTLWLDVAARRWSDAMLADSGMRADQMPVLHEGPDAVGTQLRAWAGRWGPADGVRHIGGDELDAIEGSEDV